MTYGGVDLRQGTHASLRERIVVVPQEGFLFNGTIRENVRLARITASNAEVEAALLHIEGIEEALVVGVPDPEWGQRVVAYYTGAEVSGLKEQLRQWLAPYKVPKSWIRCDALPLDAKGKFVAPRRSS